MSKPLRKNRRLEESEIDPWKLFLNAMRSPVTRDRYSTRVAKFFDFIEIPGRTLEQKAVNFARKGRNDAAWAFSAILKFVYYQREILHGEKKIEISKPIYAEGSTLPYLGKNYKIQVKILDSQKENAKKVEKNSLVHKNELFLFNIHSGIEENQDFNNEVRNLYENWLYHKAKIILKDKVHIFSKKMGIKPNKVVIKNLKNRWASITKNNEINLNINLIKAPQEIIDYIIIHELCHFMIKGHHIISGIC
jgi:predicted metal-dependent hydrolase